MGAELTLKAKIQGGHLHILCIFGGIKLGEKME
jgi:hypothetical protein